MTYKGWYAIKLNQPTNQPTNRKNLPASRRRMQKDKPTTGCQGNKTILEKNMETKET